MAKILSFLSFFCVPLQCWTQGTVLFANHPDAFRDSTDRRVYLDSVGGTPLTGSNWAAQLWYGTDANSLTAMAPPITFIRNVTTDHRLAGTWVGGTRTLNGFGPTHLLALQVKIWDMSLFSTYDEASASPGAIFGASEPFLYRVPPTGTLEGFEIVNFRPFALVPEPSVLLVSPLLVALFLVFSRREGQKVGRTCLGGSRIQC